MSRKSAPSSTAAPAPKLAADRIRATARELFYREGIRAVGVDAIVSAAGVTKPSLYRSFSSKDELAASYLRDYEAEFWSRFDAGAQRHPDDPRAQLRLYLESLAERAANAGPYRGCGLSNAAVEYPDPDHPARLVAEAHKRELRRRLIDMARRMGAREPEMLGDGLMLLIEGAFVSGQLFHGDGPARHVARLADRLIEASL
ncbi:TetR/AcrR family transcriptional regulator [Bordetella bronchiseptica]|uniref:TetR/AcrR family transcriptional regulator n=1 Tax=Bordetella bronchiseptica TaxID=518 RepID=UPI00028A5110|nr:TetR/AcrR family transcriptional regulator [Bordetella bronchiseptica]AWQ06090.1 TetR family transcriptional regulator [Bordetella bronchiseptica]KAK51938.1 transcriptional regulator, TetR family [Bordetella bronchiseptica OSU054]KDB78519.1 transcriptional regulator, TetR family [Bordetella bronchiseptica CA90 BB1334]KDC16509.1 transcriptional regulator, TetR family [Bordetella bronchiseptica E014]KDC17669.1 transcriptional regulator, TetR family [Bordetella bronchiseptica F-1]